MYATLAPNQMVKLLAGARLHDAQVTGLNLDFICVHLPTGIKLVRRQSVYALPGERVRLEQDIQASINRLQDLLVEVSSMDDCEQNES